MTTMKGDAAGAAWRKGRRRKTGVILRVIFGAGESIIINQRRTDRPLLVDVVKESQLRDKR